MDWFSVHVETRAPAGVLHAATEDTAADKLMDLLEDYDGIVSAVADSWSATVSVEASGSSDAVRDGAALIESLGAEAGLPGWPAVRVEAVRHDILMTENARPTLPDLVSAPEAAQILGVSGQRLHELATGNPAFPEPAYQLRAGKLWLRSAIEAFDQRWERKVGRPRKASAATG